VSDTKTVFAPHWLSVSIRKPLHDVMALVASHFMDVGFGQDAARAFVAKGYARFYGARHVSLCGITIDSEFTQKSKDHCLVNVPGSAFDQLPAGGLPALAAFLGHLVELQPQAPQAVEGDDGVPEAADYDSGQADPGLARVFKVTRLDLAFDHVPFTVEHCITAGTGDARNVRSPVRKGTALHSLGEREAGEDGDTFVWGSRKSKSRLVRAYDRRGFVRFEMEWRGDRSDLLARELANLAPESWAKRSIAHLRDFIDFVDRAASLNVSRCPLLPWWAAFVNGVDRIHLKIEKPSRPLVDKVASGVFRTRKVVAKLYQAFGLAYVVHHLARMGEFTFSDLDRREVEAMRELKDTDPECVRFYDSFVSPIEAAVAKVVPIFTQSALCFGR
jgi:hypothetical protein